jgi:hypothetical protein
MHEQVEALLPTLAAEDRHAFKAEIRRRREAKHNKKSKS